MLFTLPADRPPRVHFCGIGGTAMVAGARLAVEAGWEVRGSDNPLYPPTSVMVEALGVPVSSPYAAANLDWEPDFVVIGNALSRGNPEVETVLDRGLPYVSLAEWLKDLALRGRESIVIAGTHGKTTTTAVTAFLLDQAGLAPGFLIGGQPLDFQHSSRLGSSGAPFVVEGDEYDTAFFDKRAKFLHYVPRIAVVTSIEFDHGDIYPDVEAVEVAFRRMLRQIPQSGTLILCADDARALALREHAYSNVTTYGYSETAEWRGILGGVTDGLQEFTVAHGEKTWGTFTVPAAGRHNLQNVLAAVVVAATKGVKPEGVAKALPSFKGVKRRLEIFHEAGGMVFIDDFAHHPTAIAGAIDAVKTRWPDHRVCVLFEPRSNTTVTNRFQDDIARALDRADVLWIGPIHRADTIPAETRLDRAAVVNQLQAAGVAANFMDDVDGIVERLRSDAQPGDIVLCLSNGAFGGIYEKLKAAFSGE